LCDSLSRPLTIKIVTEGWRQWGASRDDGIATGRSPSGVERQLRRHARPSNPRQEQDQSDHRRKSWRRYVPRRLNPTKSGPSPLPFQALGRSRERHSPLAAPAHLRENTYNSSLFRIIQIPPDPSPSPAKQTQTQPRQANPKKIAWICLVLFVRVGTYQWVTAISK